MKDKAFEKHLRQFEVQSGVRLVPQTFTVIRVDGRAFHTWTKTYEKPYCAQFKELMVSTTVDMLEQLGAIYAYTQSDEISLLFPRDWMDYGRRVEKLVSVSAGIASAQMTHHSGRPAVFDSRVISLPTKSSVKDYFRWRQEDAARNALFSNVFWDIRKTLSAPDAYKATLGMNWSAQNEFLFDRGINFNQTPLWQRRGIGVYRLRVPHEGVDPRTGEKTRTTRSRLIKEEKLLRGELYGERILHLVDGPPPNFSLCTNAG
jgi:tRNA(His) guanylyltransferase